MMSTNDGLDSIKNKLDPNLLGEIVKRTVEAVHPLRIILFGSAALVLSQLNFDEFSARPQC